jgi:poly(3-hydroxybutyrate) depolymerase
MGTEGRWAGAVLLSAALILAAACAEAASEKDFVAKSYTDDLGTTPYRLFVPKAYDGRTPLPLVVFLHGAGERGTDNLKQIGNRANGAMVFAESKQNPCLMAIPQCPPEKGWYDATQRKHVPRIIEEIRKGYRVDADRIYIAGISLGGNGTWVQLADNPGLYAAAVHICGWGAGQYDKFKAVPIWAFHAADDPTVKVKGTDDAVREIRSAGGDPIYTRYEKGGHGSWVTAFRTQALVEWLFAQRRGARVVTGAPVLVIRQPSDGGAYVSPTATAKLSGTASDPKPISVNWTNSLGGEGAATGTVAWSVSDLPLKKGGNLIRIMATTSAYNENQGGQTTYSRTITITSSGEAKTAKL